jgi:asparagine synthase (glutamine-hydrolysing)
MAQLGAAKMCGIAGLFDVKGWRPFELAQITSMADAIAHRGPDGAGFLCEPGLALGHRRLAVIDLDGGAQPMCSEDGSLRVVFNGEIYNFRELRAELEVKGFRFSTRSDTEVLLHGWRAWGADLIPRLNGMFAFALHDKREETLILARDRFGKKPLHYATLDGGVLAFASEIKALLTLPGCDRRLDSSATADFFTFGYIPDPKTIYRAIRKLPPAHFMVVRRGRAMTLRRYWSVLDTLERPQVPTAESLIDELRRAVSRRLIADVPLGALLSGGVDSSAIVALMVETGVARPRTFSIAFGERDYDESAYARRVAERYGAEHEARRLDLEDLSLIDRLPEIYDEPFGDVSAIPTFAICAQARRSVTVALSGDGGDEALAGYRRYAFHMFGQQVRGALPARLRRPLFTALADRYPRHPWIPRPLRAATTFRELALDPAAAYARMVSALDQTTRDRLFTPEFRRALDGYQSEQLVRAAFEVDAPLDLLQRAQYADIATYLPGDILTKVDRASMANSLELRSPMLDPSFFSWSFRLAPRQKLAWSAGGKALLKRGLESRLPRDLLYRPKKGFSIPLARWFRGPLREHVRQLAESPWLEADGALRRDTVRNMADAHLGGASDQSKALWLVWVYEAFLRHNAAQSPSATRTLGSRSALSAEG